MECCCDNGSGKSTVGDAFESIAYCPVTMTDPCAANLFRVLGQIEMGQCTMVADEAQKIDQSLEIMSILKTGYHIRGKVARTNNNNWKQEFFQTYCLKMIIAERSANQNKDKGEPKYDIKVLNPAVDTKRQELLDELVDFRKLMLMYRLLHFKDSISDIDIGIDGRDKELCKPTLQLFYNAKAKDEIQAALQKSIDEKNQRKESTIKAVLFLILANLISVHGNEVPITMIWSSIKNQIGGSEKRKRPDEYHTFDYGRIYRNTITNIICDKFGAKRKQQDHSDPEIPEGSEGSIEKMCRPTENRGTEKGYNTAKSVNTSQEISSENTKSDANLTQEQVSDNTVFTLEPSELSEPSAIEKSLDPNERSQIIIKT